MRAKCREIIALVSARLPDISRVPQKRQITGALILSALLHLLVFLGIVLAAWFFPEQIATTVANKPIQIDVQLIPAPSSEKRPIVPELLATIDAEGLQESEAAPKAAAFESSQNMQAASPSEATGLAPLPSQAGADLPFVQFQNQRGEQGQPESASTDAPPTIYKMKPIPQSYLKEMAKVESGEQPAPVLPTPVTAELVEQPKDPEEAKRPEKPAEKEILLYRRTVTIPAEALSRETQARITEPGKEPQKMAMLTPPKPSKDPRYQPEQRQTRVEGSISNRRGGKPAVDAIKTPLGIYRQKLSAQIQSRWQFYTKQRMDLLALGTVRIRFFVTQSGSVQNVQIVENDSNQSFADVCEQSVREAEIPPPPRDLELMKDGRLELAFSFTLYSPQ